MDHCLPVVVANCMRDLSLLTSWIKLVLPLEYMYRSVPQIRPPFATLALIQNAGGAYTRDATFSLTIMPSLNQEMFSDSVDAGFVLVLPFHHRYLEPDCVGVSMRVGRGWVGKHEAWGVTERRMWGREMLPTLAVRLASFSVEGRGSRVFSRGSWRVHRCCGRSAFTVDSRVA